MSSAPLDSKSGKWTGERLAIVDLFRGLAAVCIVWHHLSLYAPRSDLADQLFPTFGYTLFNHALYAVAVFFVLGGLIASIDRRRPRVDSVETIAGVSDWKELIGDLLSRYGRLAIPYLTAMALLLLATAITNRLGWPLGLVEVFSWPMLGAHLLLLQDLLGYGNFSAGTWYLCIELQWSCFVLMMGFLAHRLQATGSKSPGALTVLYACLGLVSAWYWSHDDEWEHFFLYFVAQYVMGLFLGWSMQGKLPNWGLVAYGTAVSASLLVYPRPQLLVSIVIAVVLWMGWRKTRGWKLPRVLSWLSRVSYSLFLVHFLINGLVLKALDSWASQSSLNAALAMVIAFGCSLSAADLFYRLVEKPANQWIRGGRVAASG